MTTTAGDIIAAAIATSLANDQGVSELASDSSELIKVLNRRLAMIYTQAGMPKHQGGAGRGDFFAQTTTLALGASPVALPAAAFRHLIRDVNGIRIRVAARADLADGIGELPPCVIIENQKIISAGRNGDPLTGAVLTISYTPLPDVMQATSDYIGATLRTDPTTTIWPAIGDPYLVAWLARYLAIKSGDRDSQEFQAIIEDLHEAAGLLGVYIGVDSTRLAADEGDVMP